MTNFLIQTILIAGAMLAIIVGLLIFGISDFWLPDPEVIGAKPWRPFARLIFSFIMISGTALLGGALIRAAYRARG